MSRGLTPFRVEALSPCGVALPVGTRVVMLGNGALTVFSAWTLRGAEVPGSARAPLNSIALPDRSFRFAS